MHKVHLWCPPRTATVIKGGTAPSVSTFEDREIVNRHNLLTCCQPMQRKQSAWNEVANEVTEWRLLGNKSAAFLQLRTY